jgi:putative transposase
LLLSRQSPEFAGKELDAWAYRNGVKLCFSRPGKPTDNAYIESFKGKVRSECLDQHWFATLPEAQEQLAVHRNEHNQERPHTALGFLTPEQYRAKWRSEQQTNREQTKVN